MAATTKQPNIEQLVKDAGGNRYDISVAAMMFRLSGIARARKYISLLQGSGQRQLPGIKQISRNE